jgi:hypothetical protein
VNPDVVQAGNRENPPVGPFEVSGLQGRGRPIPLVNTKSGSLLPEVRLWLSVLAYNLVNLWRHLVLPRKIENCSLSSLQQR